MNIKNMESFVYVIHFNSFNKAADALFLSHFGNGAHPVVRTRYASFDDKEVEPYEPFSNLV
jgi:hypothetical protein